MGEVILDKVRKVYSGGVEAVADFSLHVADGEFVVLVGPSGCGKSTTLRMVAGLEEADSGTISIAGRVVNDVAPKDRDIAMVFQNYALYPHMTVEQNMGFALKLRRVPRSEIERRVRHAAGILGIEDLLGRRPRHLSGGQRQRVAVGRAIVREPKAFLFDEPLSNLDAKLRVSTRAELKTLHQRLRTTTLYVTHDQEEAMTLGDRIVVMSKGRIQQAAPPLEAYRRPANRFVAGFVGMPPMNFLDGRLADSPGGAVWFEHRSARIVLPPPHARALASRRGDAVLGIRPQALGIHAGDSPGLDLVVGVVEPLGDSIDLAGTLGDEDGPRIVARLPARAIPRPGERLRLSVDPAGMDVFEVGEFGANLTRDRAGSGW